MTSRDCAQDIEALAAAWAVRVDAGTLDADRQAELDAWLAADPRHRGAYLRAQAGLRLLDHARVVRTVLPQPGRPRPQAWARRPALRRVAQAAVATAAGIAALLVVAQSPGDYRTGVGEQLRLTLADGSVAMINTDSRVDVDFAEDRRLIALEQGEAWFQVAKDRARPFIVDAGAVHVRATGTAFAVRRRGEAAQVIVTEGRVLAWVEDGSQPPVAIAAGEEALLAPDASVLATVKAARRDALAWRRGEIVLNGETIQSAAAEFNRYNETKIVVRNRQAGEQAIVGYFLIDQPHQFAAAAARMTGRTSTQTGKEIVIE